MFMATFFFLLLSICIFAGLVCFSVAKLMKTSGGPEMPSHEKVAWEQVKKAIMELHSRYESTESPRQKKLRSWAGTLVICAGLCMIGILLETQYNKRISPRTILQGLFGKPCPSSCETPAAPAKPIIPTEPVTFPGI